MGSTVVTARRIGALPTSTGIVYALFETSYESNCHPHRPREEAVAFGTYADVMHWVILACGATCGGMLCGKGGSLTPHGYFGAWMSAFDDARELRDQTLFFRAMLNCGSEREVAVTAMVAGALRKADLMSEADAYERGDEISLKLYQHVGLFRAILGDVSCKTPVLAPCRTGIAPLLGDFDARLNPPCATGTSPIPTVTMYKIDENNHVAFADGIGAYYGWRYSIMKWLVQSVAYDAHMKHGDGARVMKALAAQLDRAITHADAHAPESDGVVLVLPTSREVVSSWKQKHYDKVIAVLGLRFSLGQAREADLLRDACTLAPEGHFIQPGVLLAA